MVELVETSCVTARQRPLEREPARDGLCGGLPTSRGEVLAQESIWIGVGLTRPDRGDELGAAAVGDVLSRRPRDLVGKREFGDLSANTTRVTGRRPSKALLDRAAEVGTTVAVANDTTD